MTTIHQPQFKIFDMFDDLFLLSQGDILYAGMVSESVNFWEKAGMELPPNTNVADFLLDTITPQIDQDISTMTKSIESLKRVRMEELKSLVNSGEEIDSSSYDNNADYVRDQIPWINQFNILFKRGFKAQLRSRKIIYGMIFQSLILAVLVGTVFLKIGVAQASVSKRQSVLFFCCINQGVFGSMQVIDSFPSERILTLRERAAGTYKASAYFLSKTFSELPFQLAQPIVFSVVVYFLIGLQADAGKFFLFMLFMCLCSAASISTALFISAACRTTTLATAVMPSIFEISRLFGGFYLPPSKLPSYFSWLDALSYVKYSYVGISLNELEGLYFVCSASQQPGSASVPCVGQQEVDGLGLGFLTIGGCIGVLLLYIVVLRFFAYCAVRFIKS